MHHDALSALAAEIERQNAAFDDARSTLGALGDVELHVATSFLEELDSLTATSTPVAATPHGSIRV